LIDPRAAAPAGGRRADVPRARVRRRGAGEEALDEHVARRPVDVHEHRIAYGDRRGRGRLPVADDLRGRLRAIGEPPVRPL